MRSLSLSTVRFLVTAGSLALTLAILCALLLGCGPGLLQQVQLRSLSDRATADCLAAGKSCPDMVKAKAGAGATADQIALAAGADASARSYCKMGGWY